MRDSPRVDEVGIDLRRGRIAEAGKNRLIVRDEIRLLGDGTRVCRGGENESAPRKERGDSFGYAYSRDFHRFHGLALIKDDARRDGDLSLRYSCGVVPLT